MTSGFVDQKKDKREASVQEAVYPFDTEKPPELSQVGGKGLSLILMTQQELPVPPGIVLSVSFFEPWLAYIKRMPEWGSVLTSSPEILKHNCDALKKVCMSLKLDNIHKKVLMDTLKSLNLNELFSVRSSSPEEDLEGASFAGGYETTLGATKEKLEEAIARSFASLFDHRVFLYKTEHGFDIRDPRIAVIVQNQIAAETAGVAFSLNPVNNCYDEAVINANYGLGETVVSGKVSPDAFVIDKVSRSILEKKKGNKETAVWLSADGGTYERTPSQEMCLSDEQVFLITDMLVKVEEYYENPIDIEWASANRNLYLLQARPITAYIPLPEEMLTEPGEQKWLYQDMTFAKQGIREPISVLGTDFMVVIQKVLFKDTVGTSDVLSVDGLAFSLGGRGYINVSNSVKLQGKERFVSQIRTQDALSADIIENMDEAYIPEKTPPKLRGIILRTVLSYFDTGVKTLKAFINPEGYKKYYFRAAQRLSNDLTFEEDSHSPEEIVDSLSAQYIQFVNHVTLPMTYAAELARWRMKKLFDNEKDIGHKVMHLEKALPENITLEMGLAMYQLAQFEEIKTCDSGKEFAATLKKRSFSEEFLSAYDLFMEEYGFRCPKEMDVATSRLYEQPAAFFEILQVMAENRDPALNPQAVYVTSKEEREQAYREFLKRAREKGWLTHKLFRWFYHVLVEFGGYREIHKYYYIMIIDIFRKYVLNAAQHLVDQGRLDNTEQVFDLTIADLEEALKEKYQKTK